MPTIQYRDPSGQVVTTDLENAPPQVQTLYNQNFLQPKANLQQTEAAAGATTADIPGNIARSQTANIQAQQAGALQGLKKDLSNKMTLGSAISKYTALGMSPDDVFKQYLAESPWGLPNESPTELMNKGISAGALGKIGDPGSFMDRYNTKNALLGLRDLQGKFHNTNAASQLENNLGIPGAGGNAAAAYNSARNLFTEHLSTLIPGASGASGDIAKMASSIPDIGGFLGNPAAYASGKGDAQFQSVEDQLLKTKGYSYKDLGLPGEMTPSQPSTKSGGDLLSTLLTNAGKDVQGMVQGEAENEQKFGGGYGGALAATAAGLPGMLKQYGDIISNPSQEFTQHPLSTSMAVLAPFLGFKGAGAPEVEAGAATAGEAAADTAAQAAAKDVFSKAPNKLQQILTPGKSANVIGQIRDQVVANGDKSGKTLSGDEVASDFRKWADNAKLANPHDAQAIEDAAQSQEKNWAGKTVKASDLYSIYKGVEKGFTTKGEPRSATASYIDRGVQDVMQQQLEKVAPGFGKTTELFAKTFQAEKSPIRGVIKKAVPIGLGIAGFHELEKLFGPIFGGQ